MADLVRTVLSFPNYLQRRSLCATEGWDGLLEEGDPGLRRWLWLHPDLGGTHYRQGRKLSVADPLAASEGGGSGDCCPPVVDPKTLITLLGFLAAATFFLRMDVTKILGRKRRKRRGADAPAGPGVDDLGGDAFADAAEALARWTALEDFDLKVTSFARGLGDADLLGRVAEAFGTAPRPEANATAGEAPHSFREVGGDRVSSCDLRFWRCLADLLRGAAPSGDLKGALKQKLLGLLFEGAFASPRDLRASLPEIDTLAGCFAQNASCKRQP